MKYLKKYGDFLYENWDNEAETDDNSFKIENPINPFDEKFSEKEIKAFLDAVHGYYYSYDAENEEFSGLAVYTNEAEEIEHTPSAIYSFEDVQSWLEEFHDEISDDDNFNQDDE